MLIGLYYNITLAIELRLWVDNLSHDGCERDDLNDDCSFTLFLEPFSGLIPASIIQEFSWMTVKIFEHLEFNFWTNQSRESLVSKLWGTNELTFHLNYYASKMEFLLQDEL